MTILILFISMAVSFWGIFSRKFLNPGYYLICAITDAAVVLSGLIEGDYLLVFLFLVLFVISLYAYKKIKHFTDIAMKDKEEQENRKKDFLS